MTFPLSTLQFSRSTSSSLYVKPQDNFRPFRQKTKQKTGAIFFLTKGSHDFFDIPLRAQLWYIFFHTKSTNKRNEEPLDRNHVWVSSIPPLRPSTVDFSPCDLSIGLIQISISLWRRLFLQTLRPSKRLKLFSFSWLTGTEDKKGNLIWVSGLKLNPETLSGETVLNI